MKPRTPEVVVITGASAGIGRAIARAFAQPGASIGILARGHDGLEGARREVEQASGKALVIPTDIADPHQVEAAVAQVEETFYLTQQTNELADPNSPDNLWEPIVGRDGAHGTHGAFDKEAVDGSMQLWMTTHRRLLTLVAIGTGSLATYATFFRKKQWMQND